MVTTEVPMDRSNNTGSVGLYPFSMVELNVVERPVLLHHNVFKGIVNPSILVIGILLNSIFIFVSLRMKAMRTATTFFLLNLAFADIFFLLFAVGEQMLRFHMAVPQERNHLHTSMFGASGCGLLQLVTVTTHFANLFLFTLITMDRLYCVINIHRVKLSSNRKHFLTGTALCWVFAIIVASTFPPSFKEETLCGMWGANSQSGDCPSQIVLCESTNPTWQRYRNVMKVFPFFLSAVLNFPLYAFIIKRLKKAYPIATVSSNTQRHRKQITLTLLLSGIFFFLCLLPYQFEVLCEELTTAPSNSISVFRSSALTLVYVHSALGPLVYVMTSGRYKRAFLQVLNRLRCKKESTMEGSTTFSNHGNRVTRRTTTEAGYDTHRSQTAEEDK